MSEDTLRDVMAALRGEEQKRADSATDSVLGALSTPGPAARPNNLSEIDRGRREVFGVMDQAFDQQPTEFPVSAIQNAPSRALPRSVGEAITEAGKHGITLEYSKGLWDDIDARARLLSYQFVRRTGGRLENLPEGTFSDLIAAHRWALVRLHSEASDEEKDRILTNAGQGAIGVAMDRGFGRLQELDVALQNTTGFEASRLEREREDLRQTLARLQAANSQLAAGDVPTRAAFRDLLRRKLRDREKADLDSSLSFRQLNSFFERKDPNLFVGSQGVETGRSTRVPLERSKTLEADFQMILQSADQPRGADEVLRLATNGAVRTVKMAELGVDPEAIRTQGIFAVVQKEFPDLIETALIQAASPQNGPSVITAGELEKLKTESTFAGQVQMMLDAANETPAEALEMFDPAQLSPSAPLSAKAAKGLQNAGNAVGRAFMGVLGFTNTVLEGVGDTADATARNLGWKLEPWEQQLADKQQIDLSIKEGDVDVATLMRWVDKGNNPVGFGLAYYLENLGGAVANLGEFMQWASTGEGGPSGQKKLGIGRKIAAELQQVPSDELTPAFARSLLADAMSQLAEESLDLPDTRKRLEEMRVKAAHELREGRFASGTLESVKAALYQVGWVDLKETFNFITQEPAALPVFTAVGFAGGKAAGSFFRYADTSVNRMVGRMSAQTRLLRRIGDLEAHDPAALRNLQRAASSSKLKGISDHQLHAIADIADQLADEAFVTLRDAARLTTKSHDRFWQKRRAKIRDLDKHMRGLSTDQLEDVLDVMGAGQEVINALKEPARLGFMSSVFQRVTSNLRLGGFKLTQGTRVRNAQNLARRVQDALNRGMKPNEIMSMPVPLVGDEDGYRWWGQRVLDNLGRTPTLARMFGRRLDYEDVGLAATVGRWAVNNVETMATLRDLNLLTQGRQMDLIGLARRRVNNVASVFARKSPRQYTTGDLREIRRLRRSQLLLDNAEQEVKGRAWDQTVELSRNEAILDELTFYDINTWWKTAQGSNAKYEAWQKLGRLDKKTGQLESIQDFEKRMAKIEQDEADALNGKIRNDERKATLRRVRTEKKKFLRTLYDRKLPEKVLELDDPDVAFSNEWSKRVVDKQGVSFLERSPNAELRKLKDLANTFEASTFRQVFDKNGGWDFGRPIEVVNRLRQIHIQRKGELRLNAMKIERFFDELSKLPRAKRREFDKMLSAAGRGDFKSFDDFFAANPALKARFAQGSDLENLGRAFEDMEAVRTDLLTRMHNTGKLSKEAFDEFLKPYAPQLYAVDEFPQMVGRAVRRRLSERGGQPASLESEVASRRLGLFEVQRDIYKTRLLVQKEGTPWVNKLFDSPAEAEAFVKENWGINKSGRMDRGIGIEGQTGFMDSFAILNPLGPEHAAVLGLKEKGSALGKRVAQLMRESAVHDLMQAADRPGWTVDAPTYLRAQQTARGKKVFRNFVEVKAPQNSDMMQPLAGKYVHKRVLNLLQHFFESEDLLDLLQKQLVETALSDTPTWGRAATRVFQYMGGVGELMRKMLSTNLISRLPSTHVTNRLYDRHVLARVAGGRGYLTSEVGRATFREAKDFLLGFDDPKLPKFNASKNLAQTLKTHPSRELIEEAIQDGMIGDTLVGNPLTSELRRAMAENFWGPSEKGFLDRYNAKVQTAKVARDARLARTTKVLEEWADGERQLDLSTVSRLEAEKKALEEAFDIEGEGRNAFGRRATDLVRWLVGEKNAFGTFDEAQAWSTQLYAREGNIDRLGTYMYLRRQGFPRELAAARVRMFMQDYSNIRGFVKVLRRNPLANPIFSYPAEFIRINSNILRHHPEFLVGMSTIAPTLSAISIMSQGLDPFDYWAAQGKDNILDSIIYASGGLELPSPTGGLMRVEIPALNPFQLFARPFGMAGALLEAIEKDGVDFNNPLALAASLGTRVASKFAFGNPVVNAGFVVTTGRDPVSQERLTGGVTARTGKAGRELLRMMVPGVSPWMSNTSETTLDALRLPPNMNTDRIVSASERTLQAFTGIKVRGGALDDVESVIEFTTGAKPISYGTRLLLQTMGVVRFPEDVPIKVPDILPKSRGVTEQDVATMIFYANKKFQFAGNEPRDRQVDDVDSDMRTAYFWQRHAEKRGDKAAAEWAKRVAAKARDRLKENLEARRAFAEVADEDFDMQLEKELSARVKRVSESTELGTQFANAGLNHQVRSLVAMSAAKLNDTILADLAERLLFVNQDTFETTTWTNPAEVSMAIKHIETHLQTADAGATGLQALEWVLSQLIRNEPAALLRNEERLIKDQATNEAFELWKLLEEE